MESSREKILSKVRKALQETTPMPFPEAEGKLITPFKGAEDDLAVIFAEEFTLLGGKFAYCASPANLEASLKQLCSLPGFERIYCPDPSAKKLMEILGLEPWPTLADCDASLSFCEAAVARTGSVLLSSAQTEGRTAPVYAPIHIIVALTGTLVYDVSDALMLLKHKFPNELPSFITFATGPSRTADIEKTLVTGVHGPREVYCFLLEN